MVDQLAGLRSALLLQLVDLRARIPERLRRLA